MSFRWIYQMLNKLWVFFSFLFNKQLKKVISYQPVKYDLYPLSPGELSRWARTSSTADFGRVSERWADDENNFSLSLPAAVSRHRLSLVQRKTLVLDLDETLIHSHHDGLPRNPTIKPGTPHDFTVRVLEMNAQHFREVKPAKEEKNCMRRREYRAMMFTVCCMLWLQWERRRQLHDQNSLSPSRVVWAALKL